LQFSAGINDLEELLTPLHEAQKMPESDSSHIGMVTNRGPHIKAGPTRLYVSGRSLELEPVAHPSGIWGQPYEQ